MSLTNFAFQVVIRPMLQVVNNVNYDALKLRFESLNNLYLPSGKSALIKSDKSFGVKVIQGVYALTPKKDQVDALNKNFEARYLIADQTLFYILAKTIAAKKKIPITDVPPLIGFDMEVLPDQEYMLKLLATIDPDHAVIKALLKRGAQMNVDNRNILFQNALENIILTGKVQGEQGEKLLGLEDSIERNNDRAKVYMFMKFKIAKINKKLKAVAKLAQTDAETNELVKTLDVKNKVTNAIKQLPAPTAMQIERV